MPRKKPSPAAARPWQPLAPGDRVPFTPEQVEAMRRELAARDVPAADIDALLAETPEMWLNDRYVVSVDRYWTGGPVSRLSIRRTDRKPIRDWRDLQRIKNEIAGFETEAVELFPADARLMDSANSYWLWCLPPGQRFPFGFDSGLVADQASSAVRWKQRALPDDPSYTRRPEGVAEPAALMPGWDALLALPVLDAGWNSDLRVDTGDFRLWTARTGLADGEPYEHTVYVEAQHSAGGWLDLGHYDGDDPPAGLPGVTPHAFRGEVS